MPKSAAAYIAQIEQTDQLYDANRDALQMRLRFNLSVTGFGLSSLSWQRAWDRCPDLKIKADVLMRQRGRLQLLRDEAEHREWKAEQRSQRARNTAEKRRHDRTTALAA